jgi:NADPH:quinone reductase-like Zn-dependent oxidoreductase
MSGYAANSIKGPKTASFKTDLPVPKIGSLHEMFLEIPGNYSNCEVLVKVMYSSVNPSDITPSIGRDGDQEVVLGSDMAGVVVNTGSNCKRLKEGSHVWGDIGANAHLALTGTKTKELGAYGEYTVALESQLGIIPPNMTFQEAGSLPKVALTSYKALAWYANAPWISSDNITVVVLGGSGGTGTTGIQLAKHFGAGKIISTCGADNFNYCKANGADQLIDYHTHNWWDVLEDNSVQVIYDTVGEEGTGNRAMQKLTSGGYFITIAGSLATKVKPGVTQNFFINSDTNLNNIPEMDALGEIAMAGALRMPKFYKTFKLEDVAQGFNVSRTGHVVGKVSIEISQH